MCCPLLLVWMVGPRVTAVLLWLVTGWFRPAFDSLLALLLGIALLPHTTVWYAIVQSQFDGTWSFGAILGMVVAVLFDASGYLARAASR